MKFMKDLNIGMKNVKIQSMYRYLEINQIPMIQMLTQQIHYLLTKTSKTFEKGCVINGHREQNLPANLKLIRNTNQGMEGRKRMKTILRQLLAKRLLLRMAQVAVSNNLYNNPINLTRGKEANDLKGEVIGV